MSYDIVRIDNPTPGGVPTATKAPYAWGYCDNCDNAHLTGPRRPVRVYRFTNPAAAPGTGPQDHCTRCIDATPGLALISAATGHMLAG